MKSKDEKIVPDRDVTFEPTDAKPDTLETAIQQGAQANVPQAAVGSGEGMRMVAEAYRAFIKVLGFSLERYATIDKRLDTIVAHIMKLTYIKELDDRTYIALSLARVKNSLVKSILTTAYGTYLQTTDIFSALPDGRECGLEDLTALFPEMDSFKVPKIWTGGQTLINPYLFVLMAEPDLRPFLAEATLLKMKSGKISFYDAKVDIDTLTHPLAFGDIIAYGETIGEKNLKRYIDEIHKQIVTRP